MEVTYELTTEELIRHFAPRLPLRQRLNQSLLSALPLLVFAAAYYDGMMPSIVLEIAATCYGLVGLMLTAAWGLRMWNARMHKTETYCVHISRSALSVKEIANDERCYPWAELGDIRDDGKYFLFTTDDRRYLAVIPASAFNSTEQANFFLVQSLRYWQAARNEVLTEDQTVWPPAPRLGK